MAETSPGWHPDPTGRFEHRYWDGGRWTEHVSRQGAAGVDPLDGAPQPGGGAPSAEGSPGTATVRRDDQQEELPARRVHVDASVRLGLTGYTRVFADEHALWNGDRSISWADVTGVNYGMTRMSGSPVVRYEIRLFTGKKQHLVKFEGRDEQSREVYDRLTDAVFEHVSSRILAEVVARVDAGEEAELGGFTFSREGGRQGRKSFRWSDPVTLRNSTVSSIACVYVLAEQDGKTRTIGQYDFLGQNGCLVPTMLDLGRERYAS